MAKKRYFTANALKTLHDAYAFDCDAGPCYAYHALRNDAKDFRPGADYVSYSDMVWHGKAHV